VAIQCPLRSQFGDVAPLPGSPEDGADDAEEEGDVAGSLLGAPLADPESVDPDDSSVRPGPSAEAAEAVEPPLDTFVRDGSS